MRSFVCLSTCTGEALLYSTHRHRARYHISTAATHLCTSCHLLFLFFFSPDFDVFNALFFFSRAEYKRLSYERPTIGFIQTTRSADKTGSLRPCAMTAPLQDGSQGGNAACTCGGERWLLVQLTVLSYSTCWRWIWQQTHVTGRLKAYSSVFQPLVSPCEGAEITSRLDSEATNTNADT